MGPLTSNILDCKFYILSKLPLVSLLKAVIDISLWGKMLRKNFRAWYAFGTSYMKVVTQGSMCLPLQVGMYSEQFFFPSGWSFGNSSSSSSKSLLNYNYIGVNYMNFRSPFLYFGKYRNSTRKNGKLTDFW